MKKPILYVGCSLTHAPDDFKGDVIAFKEDLRARGFEILEFTGLKEGTAEDVYEQDVVQCVGKCDLFLAICDYPSTGLGYEIATSVEKHGKPTIAIAHEDSLVTRLILGINKKNYIFKRYRRSPLEIISLIESFYLESVAP